jgi:hypothetical protein
MSFLSPSGRHRLRGESDKNIGNDYLYGIFNLLKIFSADCPVPDSPVQSSWRPIIILFLKNNFALAATGFNLRWDKFQQCEKTFENSYKKTPAHTPGLRDMGLWLVSVRNNFLRGR